MARKSLTDKGVAALKPRHDRYSHSDPQLAGHFIRVTPNKVKTYICVARNPDGKQVWTTIGNCDVMPIEEARKRAKEYLQRIRDGLPAIPTKDETFATVAADWIKRHGEKKQLRSLKNIRRLLHVHVYPKWKDRAFADLKRSDVTALLDHVEDNHGARQADLVLTVIRSVMNWEAKRRDDYNPPVVKGMQRQDDPKKHARTRILDDDEIGAIWNAAEKAGRFGAIIKLCLLTGQRRTKISTMKWDDVSIDGTWSIPAEAREKENAGALHLPASALDIIAAQTRLASNPYIFGTRQDKPFSGFSVTKTAFDKQLSGLKPWVIHDLRRTARSLMSRAGVPSEHAERVMGHAIGGVEEIYNRHSYATEKRDALTRLASLINSIVHPRGDNVMSLQQKRAKR